MHLSYVCICLHVYECVDTRHSKVVIKIGLQSTKVPLINVWGCYFDARPTQYIHILLDCFIGYVFLNIVLWFNHNQMILYIGYGVLPTCMYVDILDVFIGPFLSVKSFFRRQAASPGHHRGKLTWKQKKGSWKKNAKKYNTSHQSLGFHVHFRGCISEISMLLTNLRFVQTHQEPSDPSSLDVFLFGQVFIPMPGSVSWKQSDIWRQRLRPTWRFSTLKS